jgi:hypothetical protein
MGKRIEIPGTVLTAQHPGKSPLAEIARTSKHAKAKRPKRRRNKSEPVGTLKCRNGEGE